MITVEVDVQGLAITGPDALLRGMDDYTPVAMQAGMSMIAAEIQRRIKATTQRITGRLFGSVQLDRINRMIDGFEGRITVGAPYARYLEEGTRYIIPRRFVKDAINNIGGKASATTAQLLAKRYAELAEAS